MVIRLEYNTIGHRRRCGMFQVHDRTVRGRHFWIIKEGSHLLLGPCQCELEEAAGVFHQDGYSEYDQQNSLAP